MRWAALLTCIVLAQETRGSLVVHENDALWTIINATEPDHGMIVVEDGATYRDDIDVGMISRKSRYLGKQADIEEVDLMNGDENATELGQRPEALNGTYRLRRVVYFDEQDIDAFCGKELSQEVIDKYEGTILILDGQFVGRQWFERTCFTGETMTSAFIKVDFFASWCNITDQILIAENFLPGLFVNDHDGSLNWDLHDKYPWVQDCTIAEVKRGQGLTDLLTLLQENENQNITGILNIVDSPCLEFFESVGTQILMRLVLGGGCLVVATIAALNMVYGTIKVKENQTIGNIVLIVNTLTLGTLGVGVFIGGMKTSEKLSVQVNTFLLQMFIGSGAACDYLLACKWYEFKEKISKRTHFLKPDVKHLLKRNLMFAVACVLILVDWVAAFALIGRNPDTANVMALIPVVFFVLQVVVIIYLSVQVHFMVKVLRQIESIVSSKASNVVGNGSPAQLSVRLNATIRYVVQWVTISNLAGVMSLACLVVLSQTRVLWNSCEGWTYVWTWALLSRLLNGLSQIKVVTYNHKSGSQVSSEGLSEDDGQAPAALQLLT